MLARFLRGLLAGREQTRAQLAPGALRELVGALVRADRCDEALAAAHAAASGDPRSREARFCLAFALHKLHQPARALEEVEAALAASPDDADLHDLRGSVRLELRQLEPAIEDFERALALRPGFALAGFHLALARLLGADYERGWEGYELRRLNHPGPAPLAPEWDGSPLAGRSVLVRSEQGLGDEIMFASLLPELIAAARAVSVECDPRLVPLFARSFPRAFVFGRQPDERLPEHVVRSPPDIQTRAGSLARFMRRTVNDFPRHGGYLSADQAKVARWRARLAALGPGIKVGVSWVGGVRETRRALRSLALERLLLLAGPGSTHLVSLQYTAGAARDVADASRHGADIVHWQEAIDDYDETAALVCALDAVVSVCTTVVHLAGALGRPAFVLVPFSPEWRYGFSGPQMPWYPSVRLLRQPAPGDWDAPIRQAAAELARIAGR